MIACDTDRKPDENVKTNRIVSTLVVFQDYIRHTLKGQKQLISLTLKSQAEPSLQKDF